MPETVDRPLEGIRVLELGELVAGPACARWLAGFGADVIKVEPLDGERARRLGGRSGDQIETAPLFLDLNIGKRGIALALEDAVDRQRFLDLITRADVFVENQPVGRLSGLGLGHDVLTAANPRLVSASISPFGETGPKSAWLGHELNVAAASGYCLSLGLPDREPLTVPLDSLEGLAALHGTAAIVAALIARDRDGIGQHVDVASTEVAACVFEGIGVAAYLRQGHRTKRAGYRSSRSFPHAILPCANGYVAVHAGQPDMWTRLVTLMDDPAWTDDPRFASRSTISRSHADEAYDLMTAWSRRHTKEELLGLGIEHHIPIAPVRGLDEVLTDEHLRARGAFIELDRRHVGRLTHVGAPIEGTLSWTVDRPAPTLGQHDDDVGAELDANRDADPGPSLPGRPATVPSAEGPLAGIRVIDFGHILAGPLVGGYLSDLGAEVIRVESRSHLDVMRTRVIVGRPLTDDPTLATDASIQFQGLNRGKSSITVNFKDPRGRALVLRLVAASDLVIDNFSAGVLDRVGLGYDDLRAVKPDVIQLSLSGAGQSGPLARMVAYAPIMTAMSGHSSLAGYPGERPLNIGPFGDSVAAAHALMALLVAILARRRTGRGQRIDLSAYGAATSLLGPSLVRHQLTGEVPGTLGNSHPDLAPHGIYRCRDGLDREHFVAIVVTDDAGWSTLASVASRGWASDRRFVDPAARLANRSELDAAIADWARIQERDALVDALQSGGVAATPVCDIDEMAADPHWQARGTFTSVRHPVFGDLPVARLPWQFGRSRVGPRVAASALGADTDRICTELLGMTQAEVDEMRSALA